MKFFVSKTDAFLGPIIEHEKEWWELDEYLEHIKDTNARLGEQWASNVRATVELLMAKHYEEEEACE